MTPVRMTITRISTSSSIMDCAIAFVVPDAAVMKLQGSGQRTVFVLNADNTVSVRTVETGRHFGTRYEILSGLEEGELVLTGGHTNLRSGDKVEVQR